MIAPITAREYGSSMVFTAQRLANVIEGHMTDLGLLAAYRMYYHVVGFAGTVVQSEKADVGWEVRIPYARIEGLAFSAIYAVPL